MLDIFVNAVDDGDLTPYLLLQIMFLNLMTVSLVECTNVKIRLWTKQAGTDVSTWHFVTLLLLM